MSNLTQAGQYELVSVYLSNYTRQSRIEVSALMSGFTITESMSAPFLTGTTTIFDSDDILSKLPVIGEEYIEFTYKDFFGKIRTDVFMVFSVSDIKYSDPINQTLIQYTLNFVSPTRILTDSFRVMKAFKNQKISDYVKQHYDDTFGKALTDRGLKSKGSTVEETDNIQNLVIPNLTPIETFLFFARYAYKSDSKTQTYRFFENRDSYFFGTNEFIINGYGTTSWDPRAADPLSGNLAPIGSKAKTFYYNYLPNMDAESQYSLMFNIRDIDFGEKVNTINDIAKGAYKRNVYAIDVLNGSILIPEKPYSIIDDFSTKNVKLPHSKQFIDEVISDKYIRFVLKDYTAPADVSGPAVRPDANYSDLYNKKGSYFYQYEQNSIEVEIYGHNDIVAGSLINLQLPLRTKANSNNTQKIDIERSGYYLVNEIRNEFLNKEYKQKLTLSRYGIGTV
jgi:hypothetical protein